MHQSHKKNHLEEQRRVGNEMELGEVDRVPYGVQHAVPALRHRLSAHVRWH